MKRISVVMLTLLFCTSLLFAGFGCSKQETPTDTQPKPGQKMSNGGNGAPTTVDPVKPEGKVQP